jgi:hypothetical protein
MRDESDDSQLITAVVQHSLLAAQLKSKMEKVKNLELPNHHPHFIVVMGQKIRKNPSREFLGCGVGEPEATFNTVATY